ncbi:MAG: SPFH domain-containing protein [Candidatus ainarchaeum sp.]|nr:SPFH domain-containing protein [Candidatus ainarchaeum sp.]MDD3085959.1 SPFH domain-containing protein [Candidatus ainarchaeum sp.]MDD4128257.1 SPFH domain-containing protein [Candidatus ainarchaeum sp.]MDD4467864.1 SPFH domain-containing protein [Candidatus ainarchaeum sp.]
MNLFSKFWLIFLVLLALVTLVSLVTYFPLFVFLLCIFVFLFTNSVMIIYEFERGVVFSFGKYDGMLKPGLNVVLPIVQRVSKVDLRVNVTDVPQQSPITKDNVSVSVDAVIYYKIRADEAEKSIIKVDNYVYAISQLAQTAMRNVVGEMTLDEVLSNRDEASGKIREIVDKASDPWGIKVDSVELKHIELPESMKTIMAKAAEAERIRRAAVIKASGEAAAAKIVSKAARTIGSIEGGLNLRTLQELDNISSDPTNETIFFVPLDMLKSTKGYGGKRK